MSLMWSPAPSPKQYMAAAQALRDVRQTSSRSCTTGRARTHWMCPLQRSLSSRVHRPLNTLRRQLPSCHTSTRQRSKTRILRKDAGHAQVSPLHHACLFHATQ